MELMNKSFVDCCGRLATSGLTPDQAGHLRETELHYETLLRSVRRSDEDDSPDTIEPQRRASISSGNRNEVIERSEPRNVPSWMDQSVLASTANRSTDDMRMLGKFTT